MEGGRDRSPDPVLEGDGLHVRARVDGADGKAVDRQTDDELCRRPRASRRPSIRAKPRANPHRALRSPWRELARLAMASAPTLPTPASRTIMSISPERASSSKSKRSARTGNRVVSEMKSRPGRRRPRQWPVGACAASRLRPGYRGASTARAHHAPRGDVRGSSRRVEWRRYPDANRGGCPASRASGTPQVRSRPQEGSIGNEQRHLLARSGPPPAVASRDLGPLDRSVVERLLAAEWERFRDWSAGSGRHNVRAGEALPLGVTSSFQHWDPWPITITSARGAHLTDVDGNRLLDLSMGFGAMLVGHLNPVVVDAVKHALDEIGTLFVTPSSQATDMAERFKTRFGLDMLRFTNSGTESLMYAIRSARAFTGRKAIIKIEGGYHGGYDPLQVSVKPGLDEIGPADNPTPATPFDVEAGTVHVVAYNDLGQLERVLSAHGTQIACLVVEPIIENLAIVLPDGATWPASAGSVTTTVSC